MWPGKRSNITWPLQSLRPQTRSVGDLTISIILELLSQPHANGAPGPSASQMPVRLGGRLWSRSVGSTSMACRPGIVGDIPLMIPFPVLQNPPPRSGIPSHSLLYCAQVGGVWVKHWETLTTNSSVSMMSLVEPKMELDPASFPHKTQIGEYVRNCRCRPVPNSHDPIPTATCQHH